MKVIIINGAGGCGKDTFIKFFEKYAKEKCVFNISTVDTVKKVAKILGWNGQKDNESRRYLSLLKEMSIYWDDMPFKDMMRQARYYWSHLSNYDMADDGFLFIHSREPKEIQRLVDNMEYPTITLLIRRAHDGKYGNHSDDDVENYVYDYVIDNNGTLEDLDWSAKEFYEKIKKA